MQWIVDNAEWLFGGIGVAALTGIIGLFFKKKNNNQSIKSGDNSNNNQAGRDITISNDKDGEKIEK